jgi:hypothetical protein
MNSPYILKHISVLILFALATISSQPANTIKYNGKDYYINGINVPWNAFGTDAGTHYQWGRSMTGISSPLFFRSASRTV